MIADFSEIAESMIFSKASVYVHGNLNIGTPFTDVASFQKTVLVLTDHNTVDPKLFRC